MILKTLISMLRCVWLGLELNSAAVGQIWGHAGMHIEAWRTVHAMHVIETVRERMRKYKVDLGIVVPERKWCIMTRSEGRWRRQKNRNKDSFSSPLRSENQSLSGVTTIYLKQCNTSPSHRVDQVVDCGLWNVGPLLFNGCVKLLDIGRNWNMLSYTPTQSISNMLNGWHVRWVCWPCKNWDVFSFQELCTDLCNMVSCIIMLQYEVMVVDEWHNNGPHDLVTVSLCIQNAINEMHLCSLSITYACPYHNPTATMGHSIHNVYISKPTWRHTHCRLRRLTAVRSRPWWGRRTCRWASLRRFPTICAEILWLSKPIVAAAVRAAVLRRSWRWRCWMWRSWAGVVTRGLRLWSLLDILPNTKKILFVFHEITHLA